MIDLTPFCRPKSEASIYKLDAPFSLGNYTFATDGRIAVRVLRRSDTPEQEKPDVNKVFPATPPKVTPAKFAPLPDLPKPEKEECPACEGSGLEHDCPSCSCECDCCNGAGSVDSTPKVTVALRGSVFDLRYVRMIAALSGVMLPVSAPKKEGMYFCFDGGDGLLMPMNASAANAVPAEAAE